MSEGREFKMWVNQRQVELLIEGFVPKIRQLEDIQKQYHHPALQDYWDTRLAEAHMVYDSLSSALRGFSPESS